VLASSCSPHGPLCGSSSSGCRRGGATRCSAGDPAEGILPIGSMRRSSQQRLNQPADAILPARERRRPSPLGDWAGSTFVKMVDIGGKDKTPRGGSRLCGEPWSRITASGRNRSGATGGTEVVLLSAAPHRPGNPATIPGTETRASPVPLGARVRTRRNHQAMIEALVPAAALVRTARPAGS